MWLLFQRREFSGPRHDMPRAWLAVQPSVPAARVHADETSRPSDVDKQLEDEWRCMPNVVRHMAVPRRMVQKPFELLPTLVDMLQVVAVINAPLIDAVVLRAFQSSALLLRRRLLVIRVNFNMPIPVPDCLLLGLYLINVQIDLLKLLWCDCRYSYWL